MNCRLNGTQALGLKVRPEGLSFCATGACIETYKMFCMRFLQDVLLVNPELSYSADKSNDASSSLRNTRLNGFSHTEPDFSDYSGGTDPSDRCL